MRTDISKVPHWSCVAPMTSPPARSQGRVKKDGNVFSNFTNGIESNLTLSPSSLVALKELRVHEVMKHSDMFNDFKQFMAC